MWYYRKNQTGQILFYKCISSELLCAKHSARCQKYAVKQVFPSCCPKNIKQARKQAAGTFGAVQVENTDSVSVTTASWFINIQSTWHCVSHYLYLKYYIFIHLCIYVLFLPHGIYNLSKSPYLCSFLYPHCLGQ